MAAVYTESMKTLFRRKALFVVAALVVAGAAAGIAYANHSWGGYHWARTANPFTLKLGDNVSSVWDSYLGVASADWSASSVLDTHVVAGLVNPRNCRPTAGRVEVCNSKYGNNGWLGIAQIWVSGLHITQGTAKMNDTYFNTSTYNTPSWRQLVICQEVAHAFGLDHQDENFDNLNLGTCMDYTSNPAGNEHPNQHDYDMLEEIYAHLDSVTTVGQTVASSGLKLGSDADFTNASEWGKAIRTSSDGRPSLYVRDLGNGEKVFTFVIWADPERDSE